MGTDLTAIRHELLCLAKRSSCRKSNSTPEQPCRWTPLEVKHPAGFGSFTTRMAWEFIVELLESSQEIEEIELDKPPGRKGYVLLVDINGPQRLYIKLQLGSGCIIGRSFHYSNQLSE